MLPAFENKRSTPADVAGSPRYSRAMRATGERELATPQGGQWQGQHTRSSSQAQSNTKIGIRAAKAAALLQVDKLRSGEARSVGERRSRDAANEGAAERAAAAGASEGAEPKPHQSRSQQDWEQTPLTKVK